MLGGKVNIDDASMIEPPFADISTSGPCLGRVGTASSVIDRDDDRATSDLPREPSANTTIGSPNTGSEDCC